MTSPRVADLQQDIAFIEQFAPPKKPVTGNKPVFIGYRQVRLYVIPVEYISNDQLIEVRVV